jgi:CheY-like chemotaxis protein
MDVSAVLLTGITFAAAQVAKQASDDMALTVWSKVKATWTGLFGSQPTPEGLTPSSVARIVELSPGLRAAVEGLRSASLPLQRLERSAGLLAQTRILWVDDHPEWNTWEISLLEAAGARVRTVETSRAALALVGDGYSLVVSDIARGESASEGIDVLGSLVSKAPGIPVIYYVGALDDRGTPTKAFGITNRPDELVHLILDALESDRYNTGR